MGVEGGGEEEWMMAREEAQMVESAHSLGGDDDTPTDREKESPWVGGGSP